MTPFFDRFDAIPEPEFALWFALGMLVLGLVCGFIERWLWMKQATAHTRRKRTYRQVSRADLDRQGDR